MVSWSAIHPGKKRKVKKKKNVVWRDMLVSSMRSLKFLRVAWVSSFDLLSAVFVLVLRMVEDLFEGVRGVRDAFRTKWNLDSFAMLCRLLVLIFHFRTFILLNEIPVSIRNLCMVVIMFCLLMRISHLGLLCEAFLPSKKKNFCCLVYNMTTMPQYLKKKTNNKIMQRTKKIYVIQY